MSRKQYTVNELLSIGSFRRYAKGVASAEEIDAWDAWIEESEMNREKAKEAFAEILQFEFNDPTIPNIERNWSKLYANTVGVKSAKTPNQKSNEGKLKWLFRVAAIIILASMVGLSIHFSSDESNSISQLEQVIEERTVSTGVGERKTLTFSNGSKVMLNSNSTITYRLGDLNEQTIHVYLDGEAWFDVESSDSKEYSVFAVSTPDGVIRDIGTKFMVTVQNGRSRVILQEGLVEVGAVNGIDPNKIRFSVEKGELVEFNSESELKRERVNPTLFTSWATQSIQFDRTGLDEFADYLVRRFEVDVKIVHSNANEITLEGAIYFRSLEELVRAVSQVTGIPVYQSEDRKIVYLGEPEYLNE